MCIRDSSTTQLITQAGQQVVYTFDVTNTGNVSLTGVTVSDPKCDAAPTGPMGDTNNDGQLGLLETWVYTCIHTVTQAELDAATGPNPQLHNVVTADSTETPPATDDLDIPIQYNPGLNVVKDVYKRQPSPCGRTCAIWRRPFGAANDQGCALPQPGGPWGLRPPLATAPPRPVK